VKYLIVSFVQLVIFTELVIDSSAIY